MTLKNHKKLWNKPKATLLQTSLYVQSVFMPTLFRKVCTLIIVLTSLMIGGGLEWEKYYKYSFNVVFILILIILIILILILILISIIVMKISRFPCCVFHICSFDICHRLLNWQIQIQNHENKSQLSREISYMKMDLGEEKTELLTNKKRAIRKLNQ